MGSQLPHSGLAAAFALCNTSLPPSLQLQSAELTCVDTISQSQLSRHVDETFRDAMIASADVVSQARLRAAGAPHAGAWLTALPSKGLNQRFGHAECSAASRIVLGVQFLANDSWCPRCDQILDRSCCHALACMSGGDALRLHNSLRDVVFVKCLFWDWYPVA